MSVLLFFLLGSSFVCRLFEGRLLLPAFVADPIETNDGLPIREAWWSEIFVGQYRLHISSVVGRELCTFGTEKQRTLLCEGSHQILIFGFGRRQTQNDPAAFEQGKGIIDRRKTYRQAILASEIEQVVRREYLLQIICDFKNAVPLGSMTQAVLRHIRTQS